jgi:hypothetical protein
MNDGPLMARILPDPKFSQTFTIFALLASISFSEILQFIKKNENQAKAIMSREL